MSGIEFVGPFESHAVVLNGHSVPFIDAVPSCESDGVHLCLDDRIGVDLTRGEYLKVIPFLADCIAVALGYTTFPCDECPDPPRMSPWPRMTSLADTVVDEE